MLGGNRMGPMGQGPMSGRGAGYCAGSSVPGFMNPVWGMPYGGGRGPGIGGGGRGPGIGGGGRGRGHRHWYHATGLTGWQRAWMGWPPPGAALAVPFTPLPGAAFAGPIPPAPTAEQELSMFRQQADYLEQVLGELKTRIQAIEKPVEDGE